MAAPAIGRDPAVSVTGIQWITDGYTLAFAGLLMTGGALGHRLGDRRVFCAASWWLRRAGRERLARYAAAGARHLVVRLAALDLRTQRDQLERVADLTPALRAAAAPTPGREAPGQVPQRTGRRA
ncbi:hypothetical protein ACQSME_05235 [Streptomyces sp. 2-6]|uniref:hypothetical protein n=1 Tax=Streptomyces sp. 2-6 TaxID=2978333 RepID=UPI003D0D941D